MTLGKRASTLRIVGSRNSDPRIAEMEDEFKELGNSIGMGAMGFVGKNMVIDCNIEVGYCHTAGCPCRSTPSVCRPAAPWRAFTQMGGSNTVRTRIGSPTTNAARRLIGNRNERRRNDGRFGLAQHTT